MRGNAALYWVLSLLTLLGGTAALPALLALVGLGASRWIVTGAALATGLAFAAIPVLPRPPVFEAENFFAVHAAHFPEIFLFLPLGLSAAGVLVAVALRLLRRGDQAGRAADRVLVLWLGLEIAGFFLFSPYVAARRVIGLVVAATLLAARAASRRASERDARIGVWTATAFGIALGALYFGADLSDAQTRRSLVERVARQLPRLGADRERETIWYSGHWELQYYAERAGMRPVIAGESELQPGDWLLLCSGTTMPPLAIPLDRLEIRDQLPATSAWPWSTISRYYEGPVPLIRQPETQAVAWIFRVTSGLVLRLEVPVLEREPAR
jgi:hypothetical protein